MRSAGYATVWIVQRCLGVLLVYSALLKIAHPHEFLTAVFQYRILGPQTGTVFAATLPLLELTLGIALLCGVCALGAATLASALFLIFTVGQASALLRGIDADCGCFGAGEKVGWGSLLRTVALLIGSSLTLFALLRTTRRRTFRP